MFWRPDVWDQGASRRGFLSVNAEDSCRASRGLPLCTHIPGVSLCSRFVLHRHHIELGTVPAAHFNLMPVQRLNL